jgi:hypothetical protein
MVKMTILTMTIIPFYHQMVMVKWTQLTDISTISTKFKNFNNKEIWNCQDCHDQIWIDHFDHENLGILVMVKVKNSLTILTIEGQFRPNGQKSVVIGPPPPNL